MCRLSWFLDPGGWGKAAAVGLYFIFPGICTLSLREDVILEWIFLTRKPNKKDNGNTYLPEVIRPWISRCPQQKERIYWYQSTQGRQPQPDASAAMMLGSTMDIKSSESRTMDQNF
ncbi:hypothetical protein STEG23_026412 [Scotinomys teguina]